MNKKTIIIGSGGMARTISDTLITLGQSIHGVVDLNYQDKKETIHDNKILGNLDSIKELIPSKYNIALAIGDGKLRKIMYDRYLKLGFEFPNLIHPSATISNTNVIFGNGVIVGAGSIIMSDVTIGNNNIIYTGCIIEHECKLLNHCTLGPGVKMAGRVEISDNVTIGVGSIIRDKIKISNNSIIGAGSLVLNDVEPNTVVFGSPAKKRNLKNES